MLSNTKLYSLLLLSTIATTASAGGFVPDLNLSSVSYKEQEDALFDHTRLPGLAGDDINGIGPVYFLDAHDRFVQHKPTVFSKMSRAEETQRLKNAFYQGGFQHAAAYAAHITPEDARAISSKNQTMQTCQHFAFLLMGSPMKSLRALSAECVADVVGKALEHKRRAAVAASTADVHKQPLVNTFTANSYKLDKNIWSKNLSLLKDLTKNPLGPTDYSNYGAHFELFVKDDDLCRELNANEVLNSITTSQAAKITRPACFTSMADYKLFDPVDNKKKVTQLPKHIFSEVEEVLHENVYKHMTEDQVANFGSKTKDSHCSALNIPALHKGRLSKIDSPCWNSYLTGFKSSDLPVTLPLEKKIKLIRPDSWKDVKPEGFSRINPSDLEYIPNTIVNQILAAHPEFCDDLDKVDTDKVRILVPECFIRLTADQQLKVMEKRGSSFPIPILTKLTRESVEKFDGNMSFLRNVKFTAEQIKSIGKDSQKPEEHPCSAMSKDDLIGTESLMNNMSEHCFAALTCLDELEPSDISHLPKSLLALLPYEKLMLMVAEDKEYFANINAADMKHLITKDFCPKVTESIFRQIKAPALAAVDARCAAALTFKKSLTENQIRAFSESAFRLYTNVMVAELLSAITTLTPKQFQQLSADVKDTKHSAAQLLTKEVLATLPSEYIANLSQELLGATPAASFAAFSTKDAVIALPATSLGLVNAEKIMMIPVEAVSALTVAQIQELGVALTDASTSPITHLLNNKAVTLSPESQVAATKRAEDDKERFAKAKEVTKKDASSASTVSISAFGLLLAAVALVF